MSNSIVKNQKKLLRYRKKIFKSKEKCRHIFKKEPFERKLKIAFNLYKNAEYLKMFK